MALNRPTYKVNVGANKKATERKTIFADIKPDTSMTVRVCPPVSEDGAIFTKVTNHFQLKNEEGFGMALACLSEHGSDETGTDCYLCRVQSYLKSGDAADQKVAKLIQPSPRWYLQGFIRDNETGEYAGPKLVGVSKTTAEAITDLLVQQEDSGDDFFCDPDKGQDIVITRRGSGLKTKYTVNLTGRKAALDDIVPGWEGKIITDVLVAIDQRVEDPDGQERALRRSFGDELDWDDLSNAVG